MKNSKYITFFLLIVVLIISIVVYFKTNTYLVKFYDEGVLINTIETRKNIPINEPESPIKEGYMFIGWYDQEGNLYNFENNVTADLNLSAGWGKITTDEED